MSVIIKGMEMPSCCRDCACYHRKVDSGYYDYEVCQASGTVFNDGYASVTGHKDQIDPFKQRLDNCPLEEVKEPSKLEQEMKELEKRLIELLTGKTTIEEAVKVKPRRVR